MPSETLNNPAMIDLPMNYDNVPSSNGTRSAGPDVDLDKAYNDLLWACRVGDTVLADSLTLLPQLDINRVDEWDYSPLILASLCGHLQIVKMLLARGAICERDTFQGARCIYGALNDDIRIVLLSYNISKKVDDDQPFSAHLSKLLLPAMIPHACRDLAVVFPHISDRKLRVFVVNRFLLMARSPYFSRKLCPGGQWHSSSVIRMPEQTDAAAFEAIVDYIYLRTDQLPLEKPPEQLPLFAKKLGLEQFSDSLMDFQAKQDNGSRLRQKAELSFVERAREDMKEFFEGHVLANVFVKSLDEVDLKECKYDQNEGEESEDEQEIDFQELDLSKILSAEKRKKLLDSSAIPDVILCSLDFESNTILFYPVHRAVLIRANFYFTMFEPSWSQETANLPLVGEDDCTGAAGEKAVDRTMLSPEDIPIYHTYMGASRKEVTEVILRFLYYNDSIIIDPEIAVEVLLAADELQIERLKSISELSLTNFVQKFIFKKLQALPSVVGYDVFELIEIAWRLRSERLEQHMTKLIAHNIEAICEDWSLRQKLLDLIRASAHRIEERQATDTIELVDDMRYYLAKKFAVYDEFTNLEGIGASLNPNMAEPEDNRTFKAAMLDYEHDVAIVDQLLDELGLEA
ncbi:hypothetical_protein [Candidozyma auris]|uniref:hypothetical_protein n=1 Tax=Candidozyma auris TaxID=498019 RepID=UPI000D299031|nr:hypothetical_protein [[Candida] auris]QEO22511.1 hypothetical_protein [[Candida] auris]GBL51082.1 hypothetical protein CAJCM15448_33560 [[Candida] auris]